MAAALVVPVLRVRQQDAPSLWQNKPPSDHQLGHKERKWDVQQVERLKCELTLEALGISAKILSGL